MAWRILIPNAVERDLKKLDRTVLIAIKEIIFTELAKNPMHAKSLTGLPKIFAWKARINKADFRIAYRIDDKTQAIYLVLIKSRENFYKELGKRLR